MTGKNEDTTTYKLSTSLTDFQRELQEHLVEWKWARDVTGRGKYYHKKAKRYYYYDVILPDEYRSVEKMIHLYEPIKPFLEQHREKNPFRIHDHFYHLASSQVACINLFLPILHHPNVNDILAEVRDDFAELDKGRLINGYCLEYWGGEPGTETHRSGPLADKAEGWGTDVDIAIAYVNKQGESCLWLIEHKLTEDEFSECNGCDSRYNLSKEDCNNSFAAIVENPGLCHYHRKCKTHYWTLTAEHKLFFSGQANCSSCPFKGGMNQLWRNQLMGLAIETQRQEVDHADFWVVQHPENPDLEGTLVEYNALIGQNPKFSRKTSHDFLNAAAKHGDADLQAWIEWYTELYKLDPPTP